MIFKNFGCITFGEDFAQNFQNFNSNVIVLDPLFTRHDKVSFFVTISQVMIIIGVLSMLGLYVSRYVSTSFMRNPFLIGFFGFAEISLLVWSGRFVQQEENRLVKDLRELLYPWKDEYGIVSKVRKSRGTLSIGDKKKSSTYFCLILEKIGPNADYDTESLTSAFTDDESDVEDNEQPLETSLKEITSHYDLE